MTTNVIHQHRHVDAKRSRMLEPPHCCCNHEQCASSIIDISTPDTLQRDFNNWLNGIDMLASCVDSPPNSVPTLYTGVGIEEQPKLITSSPPSTSSSASSSPVSSSSSFSSPSSTSTDGRKNRKKGTNLYGRPYCPGRPLSMEERTRIIELHGSGMKVNAISKALCISHGCVSKIISRFRTTGVILPACSPEQRKSRKQRIEEPISSYISPFIHDANGNFNCTEYSISYNFSNLMSSEIPNPVLH